MRLGKPISEVYVNALSYDDVFIIPRYSDIITRQHVDISTTITNITIPVPVLAANMDTVINEEMCVALNKVGALGALHRFQTIEEAVEEYRNVSRQNVLNRVNLPVFVSIGVNRDSQERCKELYKWGARYFIIDIAHGHSKQMKDMISWMRTEYGENVFIMAGNVATGEAATDLVLWGADSVKCGIAGGSACITKNVTGVTIPMVSSIFSCATAVRKAEQKYGRKFHLVADGGCKEIGDFAKALGCGADMIMSGKFFAGCVEAPQGTLYRGSASQDVQKQYRTDRTSMPTPEGTTIILEETGNASEIVELISGGIRSAYSYTNSRNTKAFHNNCEFGIRYNK